MPIFSITRIFLPRATANSLVPLRRVLQPSASRQAAAPLSAGQRFRRP
jgi:hypothetical protein